MIYGVNAFVQKNYKNNESENPKLKQREKGKPTKSPAAGRIRPDQPDPSQRQFFYDF